MPTPAQSRQIAAEIEKERTVLAMTAAGIGAYVESFMPIVPDPTFPPAPFLENVAFPAECELVCKVANAMLASTTWDNHARWNRLVRVLGLSIVVWKWTPGGLVKLQSKGGVPSLVADAIVIVDALGKGDSTGLDALMGRFESLTKKARGLRAALHAKSRVSRKARTKAG